MRIKLDSVKTSKGFNPRADVSTREVAALRQSMNSELGQIAPIILRQGDLELVDGLHRLRAAERSGRKYIEAVFVTGDDQHVRRMALAANSLTEKLHWLEEGRAAAAILDRIQLHRGRGKMKAELAKELGLRPKSLAVYISACRMLAPEAWTLALQLSKKHLVTNIQLQRIWQLPHDKQIALLTRISKSNDPISVSAVVEGTLASERPGRNELGRPRAAFLKTQANAEHGKSTNPVAVGAAKVEKKESDDKGEQTKRKIEEAFGMDSINLVDLQIWKLAMLLEPRLRNYQRLYVERFKVARALREDLEHLEQKKTIAAPLKST